MVKRAASFVDRIRVAVTQRSRPVAQRDWNMVVSYNHIPEVVGHDDCPSLDRRHPHGIAHHGA